MPSNGSLIAKIEIYEKEDGEYSLGDVWLKPKLGHGHQDGDGDGLILAHKMTKMPVPTFGEDHENIEVETITLLKGVCVFFKGVWKC